VSGNEFFKGISFWARSDQGYSAVGSALPHPCDSFEQDVRAFFRDKPSNEENIPGPVDFSVHSEKAIIIWIS